MLLSQHQSDANPATLTIPQDCVDEFIELASHDAVTATQVIYSASSVAEKMVGSFLVAKKIYSALLSVIAINFIFKS
jgi:alpha-D-ribose 1-methylphosphonate 5-triphosphate diphosphatase PhnM